MTNKPQKRPATRWLTIPPAIDLSATMPGPNEKAESFEIVDLLSLCLPYFGRSAEDLDQQLRLSERLNAVPGTVVEISERDREAFETAAKALLQHISQKNPPMYFLLIPVVQAVQRAVDVEPKEPPKAEE